MDGPKPYKFIGFGAMDGPKAYKFTGFGSLHGPKAYKFIGFGSAECGLEGLDCGLPPCDGLANGLKTGRPRWATASAYTLLPCFERRFCPNPINS